MPRAVRSRALIPVDPESTNTLRGRRPILAASSRILLHGILLRNAPCCGFPDLCSLPPKNTVREIYLPFIIGWSVNDINDRREKRKWQIVDAQDRNLRIRNSYTLEDGDSDMWHLTFSLNLKAVRSWIYLQPWCDLRDRARATVWLAVSGCNSSVPCLHLGCRCVITHRMEYHI